MKHSGYHYHYSGYLQQSSGQHNISSVAIDFSSVSDNLSVLDLISWHHSGQFLTHSSFLQWIQKSLILLGPH